MLFNFLRPKTVESEHMKLLFPVGCLTDIPTGTYIKGHDGLYYLNGGIGLTNGIQGKGNSFKSTIMHWWMLTFIDRIEQTHSTSLWTYDTEVNIQQSTLLRMSKRLKSFAGKNILSTGGAWVISDSASTLGDVFFRDFKIYIASKIKNRKKIMVDTPFFDRDYKGKHKIPSPTGVEIDSLSKFKTSNITELNEKIELGDRKANPLHMHQGLAKQRMLSMLPEMALNSSTYIFLSTHVGKKKDMAGGGPGASIPDKEINTMAADEKVKGATEDYFFMLAVSWQTVRPKTLYNPTDMTPLYPKDSSETKIKSTDLYLVPLKSIRCKSGASGDLNNIIVSQREGPLPSLSEYHYLKTTKVKTKSSGPNDEVLKWGLNGNDRKYQCCFLPDIDLTRTTIRAKLDDNRELRRGMGIALEMLQIKIFRKQIGIFDGDVIEPIDLYHNMIKLGYDWDKILKNSRRWWTVNNDNHPRKTLSTMTLLMMERGEIDLPEFKVDGFKPTK